MKRNEIAVLICGAGAAGLALAIDLARRNVNFRIIEKLTTPFAGSRGKGIQPRTQEVFEDLGVIDRLFAMGGIYPKVREYDANGNHRDADIFEGSPRTPGEPFNQPLMVPQFLTEQALRDRLAELGHRVEFGCELTAFEQDDDGVLAQLTTAFGCEAVRARYLIGADGGRSFIRGALGIGFPGKTLDVRALVADVRLTGLSREHWHRFGDGDMARQLAICPLAGTDQFQIQAPVPLTGEVEITLGAINALVTDRSGRKDIRIESIGWASIYSMNARLADRYRIGRVFLIGDAGHIHPPTGGQGLNTSVQDAYNLGWKIAAVLGGAPDGLLDTYEEERRPIAAGMLGLSSGLLDQMKQGKLKRGRETHQLDLGYPCSSLSFDGVDDERTLLAGDRAPDARLYGRAGQPRRIFDLLAGPHWTLLDYGSVSDGASRRAGLVMHQIGAELELADIDSTFAAAYDVRPGDVVLVRPDGYIGAILPGERIGELDYYFRAVGLAEPSQAVQTGLPLSIECS